MDLNSLAAGDASKKAKEIGASSSHMRINSGDEIFDIYGHRTTLLQTILFYTCSILTLGIFRLILYWNQKLYLYVRTKQCSFRDAQFVYVKDEYDVNALRPLRNITPPPNGEPLALPDDCGKYHIVPHIRHFTFRKMSFVWIDDQERFVAMDELNDRIPLRIFRTLLYENVGLSAIQVAQRVVLFGQNFIDVKLKPILVLLVKEALTPFYIFQAASVIIWYCDEYQYYASIIIVMSITSIVVDIYQIRSQEKKLRAMVHSTEEVDVIRYDGSIHRINSAKLVPGDLILIPREGGVMQCDALLMTGTAIVNESVLTGESVPVTKSALPGHDDEHDEEDARFDFEKHSKYTLYCGTQVLQTRYYGGEHVRAIVLRTAYSTLKGRLVRSIMYPKPVDFSFTKDLLKFVGFLVIVAFCGFGYTVVIMLYRKEPLTKILLRSLDIITIVVPPALPAAMSVGILNAQMRLKKKHIYCIAPSTLNTCGAINVVCFDKTGTLTEDGLDFHTLRAVHPPTESHSTAVFGDETSCLEPDELPQSGELTKAVATCHSLTRIHGVLHGDPLDLILFNQTKWTIDESFGSEERSDDETNRFDSVQPTVIKPPSSQVDIIGTPELCVIRQFAFSSSLQRMSVIVHNPQEDTGKRMVLYAKGSPEMILSLCNKDTVPPDYTEIVTYYAQHGYRLISVAKRELNLNFAKAQKVARQTVEVDLELLGLVVMENRLKPVTLSVINQLNRANIRTVMVTGDNLLTAMSVARECAIIRPDRKAYLIEHNPAETALDGRTQLTVRQSVSSSEDILDDQLSSVSALSDLEKFISSSYQLSIAGGTFSVILHEYPELVDNLVSVCDVWARMAPDQKQMLVNHLQSMDYTVAMCGDGANDCAALKAAHAGISLSDAEASIAAPFTSKVADIRCVPTVISEGRAALVTSFGVFKYMAGYSLTQFATILQLYWIATNLTDFQFLYIDLVLIAFIALFFGHTEACEHLAPHPPPTRLLSLGSVVSVLGQLAIMGGFQMYAFFWVTTQPWFIPFVPKPHTEEEDKRSMQGTAIFGVSVFQYITLIIIYSKGPPFRKVIFNNKPLCISLLFITMLSIYFVVIPPEPVISVLEYVSLPEIEARIFLVALGFACATVSYLFNMLVVEKLIHDVREKWIKRRQLRDTSAQSLKWERLLSSIGTDIGWLRKVTKFVPTRSEASTDKALLHHETKM